MNFVHVAGNPEPSGAALHWIEGRGGVKLRVLTAPPLAAARRGSVIVCPGRTEFIEKYFETIGELQQRGFAVICFDWRGQGLSDRQTSNALKGHFETFDDPVNDLAAGLRAFSAQLPRPHILLAHSMGGAIALRALQKRAIEADGAVFSAPMLGIASLSDAAKSLVRFLNTLGLGQLFAPSVDTKWRKENWKRSVVTSDRERHARAQGLVLADPRLALAGPTVGWIAAAADTCDGFVQPGALAHVRIPILIALAGREMLVDNKQVAEIAKLMPNAQVITIPGAKHELLMEIDEYRAQFWEAFDGLAAQVAPQAVSS